MFLFSQCLFSFVKLLGQEVEEFPEEEQQEEPAAVVEEGELK